jgi:hypothetical protein
MAQNNRIAAKQAYRTLAREHLRTVPVQGALLVSSSSAWALSDKVHVAAVVDEPEVASGAAAFDVEATVITGPRRQPGLPRADRRRPIVRLRKNRVRKIGTSVNRST